jgi:hypothetical protein
MDLSYFLEQEVPEPDVVLKAVSAFTKASFTELRRRYCREAIAIFSWKLHAANIESEVADELAHTGGNAEQTVAHWRTVLAAYEADLLALEEQA